MNVNRLHIFYGFQTYAHPYNKFVCKIKHFDRLKQILMKFFSRDRNLIQVYKLAKSLKLFKNGGH